MLENVISQSLTVLWYLESPGISMTFYKVYCIEQLIYFMTILLYPRKKKR